MKSIEFLIEALIDPKIKKILVGKGYKYLGSGADQMAFLEPGTGLVFKVFGTSNPLVWTGKESNPNQLTDAQKSFKTFYELCHSDPSNEFLPNIVEYETFVFKGKPYLQIRMERLFEFKGREISDWNKLLARMADSISINQTFEQFWDRAITPITTKDYFSKIYYSRLQDSMHQLIIHLGEEGLHKLWDTIVMLKKVAYKNGYYLDLHGGNFMLGSDGTPVISDPFYMGT